MNKIGASGAAQNLFTQTACQLREDLFNQSTGKVVESFEATRAQRDTQGGDAIYRAIKVVIAERIVQNHDMSAFGRAYTGFNHLTLKTAAIDGMCDGIKTIVDVQGTDDARNAINAALKIDNTLAPIMLEQLQKPIERRAEDCEGSCNPYLNLSYYLQSRARFG